MTELEIIYQDEDIIAINKPHGLLVHRSRIAADADEFALQLLRDQIGQKVYPAHRIDRKTSGVLLFALKEEVDIQLKQLFADQLISKKYLAIVRGYTEEEGLINYPLRKENGQLQEAETAYKTIEKSEIDLPFGQHSTSRYSLIEAYPKTERMHQIRKHLAHIYHPIIGDRPHGCNKQNKLFKEKWEMDKMMLRAAELIFNHPITKKSIVIRANITSEFNRTLQLLSFQSFQKNEEK